MRLCGYVMIRRFKQFRCEQESLLLGRRLDNNVGELALMIRDAADKVKRRQQQSSVF